MEKRVEKDAYKLNYRLLAKSIILFFTVYSIHFKHLPITIRITVMLIVSIYCIFKERLIKLKNGEIIWIFSNLIVVLFTAVSMYYNESFFSNNELPIAPVVNFFIFVVIFPIVSIDLFVDDLEFCKAMGIAGFVQSIIVILSAMTPQMRSFLEKVQDIDFSRYDFRIVGLGIAGSGGSIYLFCGFFALAYYILIQGELKTSSIVLLSVNFVSTMLVGRTGFYAAIIVFAFVIYRLVKRNGLNVLKLFLYVFLCLVGIIISYNLLVSIFDTNTDVLEYTRRRMWEILEGKESYTVEILSKWDAHLPPLDLRMMFIGTGVVRGLTNDGVKISHDGGYAKRYASIGLLMAIYSYSIYYFYVLKKILSSKEKERKQFLLLILILMVVIEYKEPFIYQLALPFVVLMIVTLNEKRGKNNAV